MDQAGGPHHIAGFACSAQWEGLPEITRAQARRALRDTVGVMVAGSNTTAGTAAGRMARRDSGPAFVAAGGTSTATMAALANATAASAYDYDDGHIEGGGIHPGSVVIPAALASVSDTTSGTDLLTAVVVGYEVALRAGYLLFPRHERDVYHSTGTAGAIGAAAAAARLLGGGVDAMRRAIEIASAHAPMATFQMPAVKESIGWGAATGVAAALMAAEGFKQSARDGGQPRALAGFPPTPFDLPLASSEFVCSLGHTFHIDEVYFKPYASCRWTHCHIDALKELMREHGIDGRSVSRVVARTIAPAVTLDWQAPTSIDHAQYSYPFVLAITLLSGDPTCRHINEEALDDREVLDLAQRVEVVHDSSLDEHYPANYPGGVDVHIGGKVLTATRVIARGAVGDPLTEDEHHEKFLGAASCAIGESRAMDLLKAVEAVEGESSLASLFDALGT